MLSFDKIDKKKTEATLGSITDVLLKRVGCLEKIDDAKAECLNIYLKNQPLAKWLKNNLPGL